jgi:hypothetical protein
MQANLTVLEMLQNQSGTTVGGNTIFNSTLPVLLTEFQDKKRVSDKCSEIADSLAGMKNASTLVSAIHDVKRKSESDMSKMRQKIARVAEDGLNDADRQTFIKLDEGTQSELESVIGNDGILREARRIMAEKSQTKQ